MAAKIHTWEAFKYHWMVWRLCGFLPPKTGRRMWRFCYTIYAIVLNITVTVFFPVTLIVNCCLSANFNDLCENLYMTITDVACNLKYINVYLVRRKLLKVRFILEKLDRRAKTADEISTLQAGIDSAYFGFVNCFRVFSCAVITSQLIVYLSSERTLMYPAWFPFDWRHSKTNFLLAHSYQTYGLIVQTTMQLANDTYPPAYLAILTAHIKALSLRVRNIGLHNRCTSKRNELLRNEINYNELIECIKDHKILINFYETIQKCISNTCFMQFICTGLAQCTLGVYLLCTGFDLTKFFNITIYLSIVTLEVFILCYSGDRLCQESENLTNAIYGCNWTEEDVVFKKTLLTFLQRSQKINLIMAGNIIPLRLPSFLKLVKTAYSVFTVLNEAK